MAPEKLEEIADFSFLLLETQGIGELLVEEALEVGPFATAELGEVIEDELAVVIVVECAVPIPYSENQPCGRPAAEVGFIAEGGEVFSDVGGGEVIAGLLELDALVLPARDELVKSEGG